MCEKAFIKENENKQVNLFYFEKISKNAEILEREHVTQVLQTLYICKLYILHVWEWSLLLLYTIFFVALTSPAKCYSQRRLCSWLYSEETLWVTWEKLFLDVLNNNNNNNDNNNNINYNNNNHHHKDLFASSIFAMALCAIEEKTIKRNKNVKIYQHITVTTKNPTTKILKELR